MDSLIERITDLVLAELSRAGSATARPELAAEPPARAGKRVVVAAWPGPDGPGWHSLRGLTGVEWLGVGCPDQLGARLGQVRCLPTPELWDEAVAGAQAVVLPYLPLALLARLALLLGDSPAVAAALAGVVQGVPVLAASDEVERVRRHANRLPAGFLHLFQQHVRAVEGLGIQLVEASTLADRLGSSRQPAATPARGRDVVTLEDVQAASRSGVGVLEVAAGTIITPLAREAAKEMGIEVRLR